MIKLCRNLFFKFLQCGKNSFRASRNAGNTCTCCVVDCIQNCRMRSIQWSLTTAGSSVRAAWTIGFIEMKFNIIRGILRIRDTTVLQSSIMVQILEVFCKSKADTLYKTCLLYTSDAADE